jgi:hypothetical protein
MEEHPYRPVPAAAKGSARRRRVEGGRRNSIKIGFTDAEFAAIITRAEVAQVSVQRYLTDAAFFRKPAVNASLVSELQGLRRLVLNMASNINQIARRLNSGGRPDASIGAVANAAARTLGQLDSALGWLGAPPPPRKPPATDAVQSAPANRPVRPDRLAAPFRPAEPHSGPVPRLFRPRPHQDEPPDDAAEDGGP